MHTDAPNDASDSALRRRHANRRRAQFDPIAQRRSDRLHLAIHRDRQLQAIRVDPCLTRLRLTRLHQRQFSGASRSAGENAPHEPEQSPATAGVHHVERELSSCQRRARSGVEAFPSVECAVATAGNYALRTDGQRAFNGLADVIARPHERDLHVMTGVRELPLQRRRRRLSGSVTGARIAKCWQCVAERSSRAERRLLDRHRRLLWSERKVDARSAPRVRASANPSAASWPRRSGCRCRA